MRINSEKVTVMQGKHTSTPLRTDLERVAAMTDEQIDYSDIPSLRDDFFRDAQVRWPEKMKQVTLCIDPGCDRIFSETG